MTLVDTGGRVFETKKRKNHKTVAGGQQQTEEQKKGAEASGRVKLEDISEEL